MPTNTISAGTDPLTALADAMDAAVEAAERAGSTLRVLVPAAGRLLGRVVYQSSYAVTFGIVFPAALLTAAATAVRPVGAGTRSASTAREARV